MNQREKRLLIVFGIVIFAMANAFGYKLFVQKRQAIETEIGKEGDENLGRPGSGLHGEIELAMKNLAERDSKEREMNWLAENTNDPREGLAVQSELENFVTSRARTAGLTVDRPKILPNDETGVYYHRAMFQVQVTGMESNLFRWLVQLQSPRDFRAITSLRLSPNREDDTQIDATVQVEQWYPPKDSEPLPAES